MKVLIVDQDGLGLSLALRCVDAGHTVRLFSDMGNGFKGIEKIDNWVPSVSWAELRICTVHDRLSDKMEFFAKKGFPFFGSSLSGLGMEFLKANGIRVPEYEVFKSVEEAKNYVLKTGERFVFRTTGKDIVLQKFIKGIEMRVSRFLGSKGWIGQWNESFGICAYFTETSKLGTETLAKIEQSLLKLRHCGNVTLRVVIDEEGKPWSIEITSGTNWPLTLGSIKGDPVQWMLDAVNGKDTTSFSEEMGVCLELTDGDSPYGIPIYGITRGNRAHIHPRSVLSLNDVWVTTGEHIATITGFGKSVSQASKRAQKTMNELRASSEDLKSQLPVLHSRGYALSCTY